MTRKFFEAQDNGATYHFVATSVDHCKLMKSESGSPFLMDGKLPDGSPDLDAEHADEVEWRELTSTEAAAIFSIDERYYNSAQYRMALSERDVGDWFCSEY